MQPHLLGGDVHAVPQPLDEEQDHPRVRVREANLAWCLASLTGVERGSDQEHVPLAQLTNDLEALSLHRLDLSLLGALQLVGATPPGRSEEHTSELQSLMRSSYAVFCFKKT